MIEVQKSKSGKIKQDSCSNSFRQKKFSIPKGKKMQNRFSLRNEALRKGTTTNPLSVRDKQVTRYKMFLNLPR